MTLPRDYNGWNTHPKIVFDPPIYNPLINPVTGELDLHIEESLKEWLPDKHFCVTALIFLKKIFYMKSYEHFSSVGDEDARRLFDSDKEAFLRNVHIVVKDSLLRQHDTQGPECTLQFSESVPAHNIVWNQYRDSMLGVQNEENASVTGDTIMSLPIESVTGSTVIKKLPFYDASNEVEDAEDREQAYN
eukprot:CAMPEP_0119043694 /NCGR_PEP_ID=MMETSP1177-20130426/24957_1 /TAXON_ID=2985 /ORGANISM="Ochromonas sp, Strain CCMP1899" /LENGTH=188 /DNA_ID=CAMNT_0007012373 /DNA_START=270 /DNA_END=836 /DNA_ORIENTATION=-